MPFLQFDLDALNRCSDLARAAGLTEDTGVAGLVRMWAACFRGKSDVATPELLSGWFGVEDPARVARALVAFGFLGVRGNAWRVRGTSRYTVLAEARRKGGLAATRNLVPGARTRLKPSTSRVPAECQPSASRAEASADPRSEIRDPRREDLGAGAPREPAQEDLLPPMPDAPPPRKPRQKAAKAAREAPAHPDWTTCVDAIFKTFERQRGQKYDFSGRERGVLMRLLARQSAAEIARRWDIALHHQFPTISSLVGLERWWNDCAREQERPGASAVGLHVGSHYEEDPAAAAERRAAEARHQEAVAAEMERLRDVEVE